MQEEFGMTHACVTTGLRWHLQ